MSRNIVCITGATSGIGYACAEKYAKEGFDLILSARRFEKLEQIKKEFENNFKIKVDIFKLDVQNKTEVFDWAKNLESNYQYINILINNAGLALGRDRFDNANLEHWQTMMQTNVLGLLYVTKALLPLLKSSPHQKHIINIGSTAGKEVYENGNVYCASKHAVDAISKSMRIDLLPFGIKVSAVHPGAVETEFSLVRYEGDEGKASAVYQGYKPLQANDIADVIYYTTQLPAHVCINDLIITCTQQANSFYLYKS